MSNALANLSLGANDDKPIEPESTEPVELEFEPFPISAHATADQVRNGLALNREEVLKPGNRIVASS